MAQRGHPGRARGGRDPRHPVHRVHRRVRPQAAHAVPVGRRRPTTRPTDARLRLLRDGHRERPAVRQVDRLPLPRRQAGHHRGAAVARRPAGRRRDPAGLGARRPVRRLERALLLRPLGGRRRRRAGAARGRPRLVHHPRARRGRGAALGPPRLRARQGVAVGGLAGVARRGRGRGLPLDPLLRLRGLPVHGHRDPGRADRPHPAAAHADGPAWPAWAARCRRTGVRRERSARRSSERRPSTAPGTGPARRA